MEDTSDKLKEELKTLADIILQDVKKTIPLLEELIKDGKWNYKKDATIEDCYSVQIVSSLNTPETYNSILAKMDTYCSTIGLSPLRFAFTLTEGMRLPYNHQFPNNMTAFERVVVSPRLLIEAVVNVCGSFRFACKDLFTSQEVEEVFRREINEQLTGFCALIDRRETPEEKEELNQPVKDGKVAWYARIYKKIEKVERIGKVISAFKLVAICGGLGILGIMWLLNWSFGLGVGEKLINIFNALLKLK